ncbi:energy-coupling factor transporter transmembrane component T family protein [Candidatus Hodarchaeum mangrovi]
MGLDSRVALLILFSSAFIFLISSHTFFQVILLFLFLSLYLYQTSLKQGIRIVFLLIIPSIFIILLNWFFVSKEVSFILLMLIRFWGLTWLFNWFLKSNSPMVLAKALWSLHIPYRIAWQISLTYRFIPTFQEESKRVYQAQISRGIPLDKGLVQKIKFLPSLVIPLLILTQEKAELFAEALFARNWNAKSPKTTLDPLSMTLFDWVLVFVFLLMIIIVLIP